MIYLKLNSDFNISLVKEGEKYSDFKYSTDWKNRATDLELFKDDIIEISFFRPIVTVDKTQYAGYSEYVFLKKIIRKNNIENFHRETTLSSHFIHVNITYSGGTLFTDVTKLIERNLTIDKILENE